MAAKITDEMRSEIAAHPGEPVPVVDDTNNAKFYIVTEARLTHLEAVAGEESEATTARLRELIAAGDASPDVPADEARERILNLAKEADARHA